MFVWSVSEKEEKVAGGGVVGGVGGVGAARFGDVGLRDAGQVMPPPKKRKRDSTWAVPPTVFDDMTCAGTCQAATGYPSGHLAYVWSQYCSCRAVRVDGYAHISGPISL